MLPLLGGAYNDLGEHRKAIEYLEQALPIWREQGDRKATEYVLNERLVSKITRNLPSTFVYNLSEGKRTHHFP